MNRDAERGGMTMDPIRWTEAEMIAETIGWWGADYDPADCDVIERSDPMCLVVRHRPTGRLSTEAGDAGRWHLDGTAFES